MKVYLAPKVPGAITRRNRVLVPRMIEFDVSPSSNDGLYKDCLKAGADYAELRASQAETRVDEANSTKGLPHNLYDYIDAKDQADFWRERADVSQRVWNWLRGPVFGDVQTEAIGQDQAPYAYASIMHGIGIIAAGDQELIDELCGPGRIEYLSMPPESPYELPEFLRGQ